MKLLRKLYFRLFTRHRRLERRFVPWGEADALVRASSCKPEAERWQIDEEREDLNKIYGYVHLERRERITQ